MKELCNQLHLHSKWKEKRVSSDSLSQMKTLTPSPHSCGRPLLHEWKWMQIVNVITLHKLGTESDECRPEGAHAKQGGTPQFMRRDAILVNRALYTSIVVSSTWTSVVILRDYQRNWVTCVDPYRYVSGN